MDVLNRAFALLETRRRLTLAVVAVLITAIAFVDWKVEPNYSLGFLYFLPILAAAAVLRPLSVLFLAVGCGLLRELFSPFRFEPGYPLRMALVVAVFAGAGILVSELNRSRLMILLHLKERDGEAERRREAEEQLRVLIETSPLAIVTADAEGNILLANSSASRLLGVGSGGTGNIADHLEGLAGIFSGGLQPVGLGTEIETRGRRKDGAVFLAHVWFSVFGTKAGRRLAAVIWDASEELRERDSATVNSLESTTRIAVGAMAHEVRNLAAAAAAIYGSVSQRPELVLDPSFRALGDLVKALQQLATSGLRLGASRGEALVELRSLMDEVRIIVEPGLRDAGIRLNWKVADDLPFVGADRYGLLQVFLNLINNSQRAMESVSERELTVEAFRTDGEVVVRLLDTGSGVRSPEKLFRPFQPAAQGTGLGLYLSRAIVRCYGGELRFEPQPVGSSFVVRLPLLSCPAVA